MTETSMKTVKDSNYYSELVEGFMKDSKLTDVDPIEKKKFMMLCVVNKLNPFKDEVYAIPRNSKQSNGTWKKVLTVVVNYKTYIKRAEETGLLDGWNVVVNRNPEGKVLSGKIVIHRKDRAHPYEMEALIEDFLTYREYEGKKVLENKLRETKPYFMMKKQLIRIGFADCFPDVEIRERDEEGKQDIKAIDADAETIPSDPEVVENGVKIPEVTSEQKEQIDFLLGYLTDEPTPNMPKNSEEAEILIRALQFSIAKKYVKENKLQLTIEDIDAIFQGDDADIVKTRKAAMKKLKELEK